MKDTYDKKSRPRELDVGSRVLMRDTYDKKSRPRELDVGSRLLMKDTYDKKSRPRELDVGSMVLIRDTYDKKSRPRELDVGSRVLMRDTYDKKSRPRELDVGSRVVMRVPGLVGKLDDSWDGPYEVIAKISPVTYQLAIPGRGSKPQTVHINMLRQWKTPDARVLRVVVADEDEKEDHHTETHQDEEVLDTDQRKELEEILLTFTVVVNPTPGRVHLLQHSINTRDYQ